MPVTLVAMMDIMDPEEFGRYAEAAARALAPYEGKFRRLGTTRNGPAKIYEGNLPAGYMFVIEFESQEIFDEFYNSAAYREAFEFRKRATNPVLLMTLPGR